MMRRARRSRINGRSVATPGLEGGDTSSNAGVEVRAGREVVAGGVSKASVEVQGRNKRKIGKCKYFLVDDKLYCF